MKVLFIVVTTSQLLNASQIALDLKKKGSYISVCLSGKKMQKCKKIIENNFIFDKVICNNWIDCGVSTGNRSFNRIRDLFDYWNMKNESFTFEDNYDAIYISGPNLRNLELYYYLTRRKKIDLFFYEEGIFEYYFLDEKLDLKEMIASYLFLRRYYKNEIKGVFVHRPEMSLTNNIKYNQIPLIKSENDNKIWMQYLENLFPHLKDLKIKIDNKIIFIDQPYEIDEKDGNKDNKLRKIFNMLYLHQKNNIIVKLHPRSNEYKYGYDIDYLPQEIPFEIMFAKLCPQNVTLVSVCSSAVFNIMLRYSNIKAVMIYKLVDDKIDSCSNVVKLIDQYNVTIATDLSRKIHVVDNLKELIKICGI